MVLWCPFCLLTLGYITNRECFIKHKNPHTQQTIRRDDFLLDIRSTLLII